MLYFRHDTDASVDDKMVALRLEHGGAAADCYWTILEQIYRDETALPYGRNQVGTKSVCHRLCVGFDELDAYVRTMLEYGLLVTKTLEDGTEALTSERAEAEIAAYQARAETARQNGRKGGRKPKRKPNRNQAETESVTESVPSGKQDPKLRRSRSDWLLFNNNNQITTAGAGAGADEPAPRPSGEWVCPKCGSPAHVTDGGWRCPKHGQIPAADPAPRLDSTECPDAIRAAVAATRGAP